MPPGSLRPLALLLLLAACDRPAEPVSASAQKTGQQAGTGAIAGVVRYLGPDLDRPVTMDEPLCRSLHETPVDSGAVERGADGGLANVLVYVDGGPEEGAILTGGPPPEQPVEIREEGCMVEPRLSAAVVGQPVRVVNLDPTLHSVRLLSDANRDVTRDLPFRQQSLEVTFETPEVAIAVRCAVHPWARGWLAILPHRYFAVTGLDGGFSIGGLPPGTYTVAFWHELLGTKRETVHVSRTHTDRLEVLLGH